MIEVAESEGTSERSPAVGASPAASRKRTARRAKGVTPRRKTSARKKGSSRSPSRKSATLEDLLEGLAAKATQAGTDLATLSGKGVEKARRAIGKAGTASKQTINRLTKQWKQMDSPRRIRFLAALLGALAAASAPIVRGRLKKK